MEFLNSPTRNLFFTGKGGVGKTSLACASAVALADRGKRVLLVSTDPASNLDEVLGITLGQTPTAVPDVPNLWALNIEPETAAREYRERMVGPYRGILPDAAIVSMEEQFSGSCTLEIAAFDEFARLLGDPQSTTSFDHVIFDTAPTGHTLRLLSLPSAWDGFMSNNTTGTSCLGPLAGLQAQQQLYKDTVHALSDANTTTLVLVTRPEAAAMREAQRTSGELAHLGVANQHLVINGVFVASAANDLIATTLARRGREAMTNVPVELARLPRTIVPLAPSGLLGPNALRNIGNGSMTAMADESGPAYDGDLPTLSRLVDEIAAGGRGVILTMGKGGVGKTTVAAAVAVALAGRGFPVHLSTTDPAAHVAATINGELPNLRVSRIDATAETAAYSTEVLNTAGANLDSQGKALLEEDLRSPCTEEIAVFRAFARAVDGGKDGFVVLDTAPTGHTILLLDAALAYHREVTRQASGMPPEVEFLLPRLRDPKLTRVLLITLPEATPVHEAAKLQEDLERAGIRPFAWVINQSLTPLTLRDPILVARQRQERPFIEEVTRELAQRVALIPWLREAPAGVKNLQAMMHVSEPRRLCAANV